MTVLGTFVLCYYTWVKCQCIVNLIFHYSERIVKVAKIHFTTLLLNILVKNKINVYKIIFTFSKLKTLGLHDADCANSIFKVFVLDRETFEGRQRLRRRTRLTVHFIN